MPSSSLNGGLGLNTVPNARMDQTGTARFHISTLDPYMHVNLGFQLADPLYVNIRQTAEISDLNDKAKHLYPGLDVKLRLLKERAHTPAITLGLQSASGHKQMGAEYLAFSKRYKSFDFTGGIGWGRMGSAGHYSNPLKELHPHFEKDRPLSGEWPNGTEDWFTGDKIGLFGGVEYFTPIKGISLKADWGADRYATETAYDTPAPWSVGINYAPKDWINLGGAVIGGEKIMAQISLNSLVQNWPFKKEKSLQPTPLLPNRPNKTHALNIALDAQKEGLRIEGKTLSLSSPDISLPYHLGQAARHIANHTAANEEEIALQPTLYGLHGPSIKLIRRDLEQALLHHQGSPQELWHNASFDKGKQTAQKSGFLPARWPLPYIILDTQASLSEEETGVLYRTSLLSGQTIELPYGFLSATEFRLNIKDNLDRLHEFRPRALLPVRSDADHFAQNTISMDRLYMSWTNTIIPDVHTAITAGYLEEMYAGLGGEVLYRPFGKRFAIGAELWEAFRRDPTTSLAQGLNGDHLLTGHINAYYEFPENDLTLSAKIGRYLAEDLGASLSLSHKFKNGAKLEGFVTATNNADYDLFGGTTHLYNGVRLNVPLSSIKYVPKGSAIQFTTAPFGRDTGQSLDNPLPLYELTEPFSMRHIAQNWHDILE